MASTLRFIDMSGVEPNSTLCSVVAEGLAKLQKELPCRFFYDRRGSELFEQICRLPEYYVTRTEHSILNAYADEILEAVGQNIMLAEFGSGSSVKTRLLMQALFKRQSALHYVPIDISAGFLFTSCQALMDEFHGLSVTGIAAEYSEGIGAVPGHDGQRLILFLGSNIGNFDRRQAVDFLRMIQQQMSPRDRILIGIDLIKDRKVLHAAYNDAAGVTAEFNKNILVRINRELGGNFNIHAFSHDAPFCEKEGRIEMHLRSMHRTVVHIESLEQDYFFEEGETIHTENSHKYTLAGFDKLSREAGLNIQERWVDSREWFAVLLLQPMVSKQASESKGL